MGSHKKGKWTISMREDHNKDKMDFQTPCTKETDNNQTTHNHSIRTMDGVNQRDHVKFS
jgi:hypothetical protein